MKINVHVQKKDMYGALKHQNESVKKKSGDSISLIKEHI